MTLLVEFVDSRGINPAGSKIFINPEMVTGITQDHNDITIVYTTSYNFTVQGSIEEVAAKLMMPDIMDRAGLKLDDLDELEQALKEKFG